MLAQICQLSRAAGTAIMAVYDGEQPLNIEKKKTIHRSPRPIWQHITSSNAA